MKGINFNQRPTPVAKGSSRATCENSTERMWELVSIVSVLSGFSDLIVFGVCCGASVSSGAFVMCSPLELVIMLLLGWQSQTWLSNHHGRRLIFGGSLFSMGREQGWDHLRANLGFGYSGSSLPSCPSISLDNLLFREDFPGLHTG